MQFYFESKRTYEESATCNDLPSDSGFNRKNDIPLVIAMHCSGGNPGSWSTLSGVLPAGCELYCPTHRLAVSPDQAEPEYSLHFEAEPVIEKIDAHKGPVYLVGHSFGGALALYVAQMRPQRIIGISLYEPCVFGWLNRQVPSEAEALNEICGLRDRVYSSLQNTDPEAAMKHFVDYWGGDGSWTSIPSGARQKMIEWAPNAEFQFDALLNYCKPDLSGMHMPVHVVTGEFARIPPLVVAHSISTMLPNVRWQTVAGAGHMEPVTNAGSFAGLVRAQLVGADIGAIADRRSNELCDAEGSAASLEAA